jgi:fumarate hydratase class II
MSKQPNQPDGTQHEGMRLESDSIGKIWVPENRYWGAQTQRSIIYFSIGKEKIPKEMIKALAIIKKAAAKANMDLGKLPEDKAKLIINASEEVIEGKLDDNFPLHVWATGSGTHSNTNVNEVLSNRAIQIAGGVMGTKNPIHPNDDVNMSQSSNDVFPTAQNIAAVSAIHEHLILKVKKLRDALDEKSKSWVDFVKTGRTHMMDAVPLTLGQEFLGYVGMLDDNLERIELALPGLYNLAIGGTAIGTGLNTAKGFDQRATTHIAEITGYPFVSAPNKFSVQGAHDSMVMMSGVLKTLAVSLYKIANDIRLMASGPRCGLQELILPANEPGSSIMPGKVNPTQCEAMAMVAVQVMANDVAINFAGAGGYLEMNVYKPIIAYNVLQSIQLMTDACNNFTDFLVVDMKPNQKQISEYLNKSLMLVTALSPIIGYDKASEIAQLAHEKDITLKEAALKLDYISEDDFDRIVDPVKMTHPDI